MSMCEGTNCPHKEKCYRFMAEKAPLNQTYFSIPPIENGKCDYYWGDNAQSVWNKPKEEPKKTK